jgi:uncharacterized protein
MTQALDEDALEFAGRVFQAARSGDAGQLAQWLQQGLPANLRNENGDSLVMLASYHGHADAARLLLEHGADPDICNKRGQVPLAGAVFKGDVDMVRLLLDHGVRVDGAGPDGRTALMMAAMFDRTEMVELLLARGADAAARDATGLSVQAVAGAMGAKSTPQQIADALAQGGAQTGQD